MKKKKGFTLIELMIVVAIIGILAAIAIPNFLKFQAKAKQSECKSNLGAIYTAQVSYFGEFNTYGGKGKIGTIPLNAFQLINWEPSGQNRYRYVCHTGDIDAKPQNTTCAARAIVTEQGGWTACCHSNIDSDDFCDTWCINDDKELKNVDNSGAAWTDDANDVNLE